MKARLALVTVLAALAALLVPTAANTYPFFDWAWGYPNVNQFHQNRWYDSQSVLQREQVFVKLDRCLPDNARIRIGYVTPSGWYHREKASGFGACYLANPFSSQGPSRVTFRLEFWNCTEGFELGHDCGQRINPQGDCYYNVTPPTGCPGGFKWYRLPEAWAYTNMVGCGEQAQCQMRPLGYRTARAE